ncbi:GumC family protein [Chloroflexota bacterium]
MEDEIDLRKYINVLLRHWKVIVSITVIAVVVAGLVSFLSPSTYQAKVTLVVTMARSEITLEPEYRTLLQQNNASLREALLALVKSDTVATKVIEQMGDRLDPSEQKPNSLQNKMKLRGRGDLIEISTESIDPNKAADIANAWAKYYESYVNSLYSGILQSPKELQVQSDEAKRTYEETQKAWEDFIGSNRISELKQQIADKNLLIKRQIADKNLIDPLESLREHIKNGPSSSASGIANSLSLILLQTGAFTNIPVDLEVSLDRTSDVNTSIDDVDALIATLKEREGGIQGKFISELQQEINQLNAELEREQAKQRELQYSGDIAWKAYTTVAGKAMEVQVASGAQNPLVRIAEAATVPESTMTSHRVMTISIALVLGLVIGVFAAFLVEYFIKTSKEPEPKKDKE